MADLSVIIPARKEEYLAKTIESIHAAVRGDTEILVVIDGEEAGPPVPELHGVRIIRHDTPIGQRQSVNEAARLSEAKFILKTDGHSMMAPGFDVELMAHCEYDWTVIPTMYNLHAHDLVCRKCGTRHYNRGTHRPCPACGATDWETVIVFAPNWRKRTDWMWFRSPACKDRPLRVQYWGMKSTVCDACGGGHDGVPDGGACDYCGAKVFHKTMEFPEQYQAFKRWSKEQPPIADVMTGQGACWFLHRDRFWDLGGLDEGHGSWGQMGVEIACKAWLSGGRHVVNRNTWFAHLFRCGDGQSFPYEMRGSDQEKARQYSIDLWSGGRWPLQMRPLEWIAEKFTPVPTWPEAKPSIRSTRSMKSPILEPARAADPIDLTDPIDRKVETPKVSILIPARNEPYLEATVRDLLKNLRLDAEIMIGLDGPDQTVALFGDERVRVIRSDARIGMRPTINRLARQARGEYLIRLDAHCMIDEGMDAKLVEVVEQDHSGLTAVVAMRYELDAKAWQRRDKTDVPYRRLSHESEDGCGLRSLPWPEWAQAHQDETIGETMTCSGSSWTCRRETFLAWGGFDERHGIFGQEGCEIACMFWLSGGRFLVHKGTWYAHWNRGKAPYSLGAHEKQRSIEHSKWLWPGDNWPHAKRPFQWLLEKFQPPGWASEISNLKSQISEGLPAIRQGALTKGWKCRVGTLWDHRIAIGDPGKAPALAAFWPAFEQFLCVTVHDVRGTAAYRAYLVSRLDRSTRPVTNPTPAQLRKIGRSMDNATRLAASIAQDGLRAPLEFYAQDGRMILWKGYRRLAILHVLGRDELVVPCRIFKDRQAAGALSPQGNLTKLQQTGPDDLHRLVEDQFAALGRNASDKYWVHGYDRHYDRHFAEIRKRAKRVCEIGVLNGASLSLWRQYFPRAELVGFDLTDKWKRFAGDLENCRVIQGDETVPADVDRLIEAGPFDAVIDDGSHDPAHQRALFEQLWPSVRQYGYYVIEDIYRSFQPLPSIGSTGSMRSKESRGLCLPPGLESRLYGERDILSLHWYYNIVFIQKG